MPDAPDPAPGPSRLVERGKNLAALVLGLCVAFVLAEAAQRAYQAVTLGVSFFTLQPGYREARFRLSPFLVFGPRVDEQFDRRRREDAYYNAQGYRTRETLGPKPERTLRVFALGGSTTEDLSNEEGVHWPLIAEHDLHRRGRTDVRVYNGAMSAYTSAHTLVRLQLDVLQYQPDVVLIMDNVNDLSVVYRAWRQRRPIDGNYLVKYGAVGYTGGDDGIVVSRLARTIRTRLAELAAAPPASPPEDYDLDRGRALFERNLRSQVSVARQHRVVPILLTMPVCESESVYVATRRAGGDPKDWPQGYQRFIADFDAYNQTIRDVAAELRVPLIDLRRLVSGDPVNFSDVVHHTAPGVHAIGEVVGRELARLLPPPSRHLSDGGGR